MIIYVTVGGMKGTTYVQIVKAVLLMGGALVMTLLVLAHYNFNLSALLGDAAGASGKGDAFLEPGLRYGVEVAGNASRPSTTRWTCSPSVSRWCSAPPACRTS